MHVYPVCPVPQQPPSCAVLLLLPLLLVIQNLSPDLAPAVLTLKQVEQLQQQVCSSGEALSSLSRKHQELAQLHRDTSQQLSTLQSATMHADTLMGAQDQDIALAWALLHQRGPGSGSRRPQGGGLGRSGLQR